MKPWEDEVWTVHEHEGKLLIDTRWALSYEMQPHAIQSSSPTLDETNARARLASSAPFAVRALLAARPLIEAARHAGALGNEVDNALTLLDDALRRAGVGQPNGEDPNA